MLERRMSDFSSIFIEILIFDLFLVISDKLRSKNKKFLFEIFRDLDFGQFLVNFWSILIFSRCSFFDDV